MSTIKKKQQHCTRLASGSLVGGWTPGPKVWSVLTGRWQPLAALARWLSVSRSKDLSLNNQTKATWWGLKTRRSFMKKCRMHPRMQLCTWTFFLTLWWGCTTYVQETVELQAGRAKLNSHVIYWTGSHDLIKSSLMQPQSNHRLI